MPALAIIPARTGSKGIPGKNTKSLVGASPLSRAIACCLSAKLERIVVATNDPDIVVPCDVRLNPQLHHDTCSLVDVVLDVLWNTPVDYDPILLVQPTQPLRQAKHLLDALKLLETYPSVASIVGLEMEDKCFSAYPTNQGLHSFTYPPQSIVERKQDAGQPLWTCDGTVYGFQRKWFLAHRTFRHTDTALMVIPKHETCRLDDMEDWRVAEQRLRGLERS